jgi:hypothetical protein
MAQAGGGTLPLASVLPVIGPPVKCCDEGDPPPTTASEDGDGAAMATADAASAKTVNNSTTRSLSRLDICNHPVGQLNVSTSHLDGTRTNLVFSILLENVM